ncbi:MAG: SAVED domain-containing protein [Burkholderiaceae bacterium]|nr:SAVED domain-containing protein [Burkholderiaceae bacterium]MDP3136628.1 SAVED domain-containing protein [Burkholderiaceae bacterium]
MKNFFSWLKGLVEKVVDYWVRPRHLGVWLLWVSGTVLVAVGGGFAFKAKGLAGIVDVLEVSSGDGLPGPLLVGVVCLACLGLVAGGVMMALTQLREQREADAQRVLVVELRGLVDTSDRSLLGSVPRTIPGRRIDCLVNARPYLSVNPPQVVEALNELQHIRRELRQTRGDTSRENVTVVAGGVMQVPLQFYAGTLFDDEGAVTLYEWERTGRTWKTLAEADDGSRFTITGLDGLEETDEVVLAVSASYQVSMPNIESTFPELPVVHMARENPLPNGLWSEANQVALTQQFLQTLGALANRGVKAVHLVLAAPATLSIRFGMAYDHRNMPELRCYHREQDLVPPYPWSIRMPKGGKPVEHLLTPAPATALA